MSELHLNELSGRIVDGRHALRLRVYYEDTDFSGNVYHANYLKFCERARSDFVRLLGVNQTTMGDEEKNFLVVRRMVCEFLKPARFDEILDVETVPREVSGARFTLSQQVLRDGIALFTAEFTGALINARGRPLRVPKAFAKLLQTAGKAPQ